MEIQSYNAELALANLMFIRIFNNIRIDRTLKDGTTEQIKVNCVFGQRSRILKNYENPEKRGTLRFPMIAINRTGYSRNPDRLNNLHNEVKYEESSKKRNYNLLTPIPIDVSYDVCIIAKLPSDIDQIASNFMVFFNSDIYVSCTHPKYAGVKLNNQIIMQDSVSEEHPDELDVSQDDFITSTFQFTFKTYLFGGKDQATLKQKYVLSNDIRTYDKELLISACCSAITDHYHTKPSAIIELNLKDKYGNDYISAVRYADISDYCITNPENELSLNVISTVTENVEVYVPTKLSDMIYDGFIPVIHGIDIGFYSIPMVCADMAEAMTEIDSYKNPVPYRDKLYWTIDNNSSNVFPYNVY